MRGDRQLRIDLGAGHPFEQLAAVLAVGAEERRELALCEQGRSPELIERQAEPLMDRLERLGLRAAEPFDTVERRQGDVRVLHVAVTRATRPAHRPTRTIPPEIAAL